MAIVAASLVVIAAGSLVFIANTQRSDPRPSPLPPIEAAVEPEPEPAPIEIRPRAPEVDAPEAIPGEDRTTEIHRVKKDLSKPVRRDPAPPAKAEPPPPPTRDRYAGIREKMRRLEASPQDSTLLLDVHRDLTNASRALPAAKGDRIRLDLAAALRTGDIEALGQILDQITKASATE